MGLIACRVQLMLEAIKQGVDFTSTLTLGRQKIVISNRKFKKLRKRYNLSDIEDFDHNFNNRSHADLFFKYYLGVKKLSIIDFSDYEGADIIHDMNYPISPDLEQSYDVVVDGGTLEHIFNFPTAVTNCMKMLKEGGSLFLFSMANNQCGHGFYQFSPELFYRIFQKENGFETKSVILVRHPFPGAELSEKQECFKVIDPAKVGRRASLVTRSPLGIMVHAVKKEHKPIFEQYPQQSDYQNNWKRMNLIKSLKPLRDKSNTTKKILKNIINKLPISLIRALYGINQLRTYSLDRDKESYIRWPK